MTDPTAQALLAAISADDPTPRLALADWLEEHDDARAAWVRDAGLWAYMAPDLRDPVPGLLAALEPLVGWMSPDLDRLLRLVGPPMVPALRAWVRGDVLIRFRQCRELLWDVPPPPADDPLRESGDLYAALYEPDWLTCYTAALDLRRHTTDVPGYSIGRLIEVCEETWRMPGGVRWHLRDAAFAALGAIGPPAEAAVPVLLAHFVSHDEESARLADIARDALIAIRPPPEVIRGRLHYTRDEGAAARLRAVLRALA